MNYIYICLEHKFSNVKDTFDRLKLQLNQKITKFEELLEKKENLGEAKTGKQVLEIKKIENDIDNLIKEMEEELKQLEKELKAQKKKPKKYPNIQTKEKIFDLLKNKIKLLKSKYNGEEIDEEEEQNNETALEKFEKQLKERENYIGDSTQDRELFEEEKNKMDEWDERRGKQDEMLDEIGQGINELKYEGQMAGQGINDINKKVKATGKKIDKTQNKVKTQNERLTELVNKIRSSDKICCDIVLILILLGLICVLYSIIKHKYIK